MGMDQQLNSCTDAPEVRHPLSAVSESPQSTFEFIQTIPSVTSPLAGTNLISMMEPGMLSNEMSWRALVELTGDGTMVGNSRGIVLDVNDAMCKIFKLAKQHIVGRHIAKLPFSPESLAKSPFRFANLKLGGTAIAERVIRRHDESCVTVEMRTRMMPDGTIHSISRDITERKREENALRESEERYRQLFELESDAILLIDNEVGQILEANTAASTLYGFSRDELVSMRNVDMSAEPEATQRATFGAPQLSGQIIVIPLRLHRKSDGGIFPVEITARSFVQRGRSVHIAAVRDITERKKSEDELRDQKERLQQLAATLEIRVLERTQQLKTANESLVRTVSQLRRLAVDLSLAEERERKRLALLLHDHLQPFLVAATMKVSLLAQQGAAEEQTQIVRATIDLIKEAINASRSLTTGLYPPILLDAGIMPGLRWLAEWIKENYGLSVVIKGDDSLEAPEHLGILVFQAVRELLFNVTKHAKSDMAMVTISRKPVQMLQIIVEDHGVGFPVGSSDFPMSANGLGLFHLRERLDAIGGALALTSEPGQGTMVFVTVPLRGIDLSAQSLEKEDHS